MRIGYYRAVSLHTVRFCDLDAMGKKFKHYYVKDHVHFIQALLDGQNSLFFSDNTCRDLFINALKNVAGWKIPKRELYYVPHYEHNKLWDSCNSILEHYFYDKKQQRG